MTSAELKDLVVAVLEDKNAVDVTVIPVAEKTVVADYFVICTGRSRPQVRAIYEAVAERLKKENITNVHVDGEDSGKWIVLDVGDVIVHIFNDETRLFYSLEKLWTEKNKVDSEE